LEGSCARVLPSTPAHLEILLGKVLHSLVVLLEDSLYRLVDLMGYGAANVLDAAHL